MPHFLISSDNVSDNGVTVKDKDLYKHVIRVLRKTPGEEILFLDENKIQYETVLKEISADTFVCEIKKQYKSLRELPLNLYVAQSVLNSDAQTSAIQKATELGVKGIIPLYTDNCAVKETVIKSKIEKWQKIATESVKQCERADIPVVFPCKRIKDIIKDYDKVIVFAEKYAQNIFFEYVKNTAVEPDEKLLVIIGPEGGFSEAEFDFFKKENVPLITLGKLIYRADTALTAALTTVINGVMYAKIR